MADVERALRDAGVRDLAEGVRVLRHLRIPTRDGTRLAADVYLPAAGNPEPGPLPAVVQYQPYRKDDIVGTTVWQGRLPRAGYAFVQLDVRGSGGSEGVSTDEYVPDEQADGVDALAWIASQPWCDGQTNFWGSSYSGFTGLQVAAHQPPSLRTVSTAYFTDDRYSADCHYRGGTLAMYYDIGYYGTFMVAMNALPPDPDIGADWARIWEQHLEGDRPYQLTWLANQVAGPYWRAASPMDHVDRITVPVFMIGGWRDGYPNPPLRLYERLRGPKRLLVGPWNHGGPDATIPGPRIDHVHEVIRWLDHWCRGRDTGVATDAPITVFMQRGEPPVVETRTLHLGAGGRLLAQPPSTEASDAFQHRPTVGGRAGGLWSGGLAFGLPGDQRADDAWSLVYRSDPLDADLAILGQARANLTVRADAAVWALALRLCDIAPDGASQLVAKGILNVTRRESTTEPAPLAGRRHGRDRHRHRRHRLDLRRRPQDRARDRRRGLPEPVADAPAGPDRGPEWRRAGGPPGAAGRARRGQCRAVGDPPLGGFRVAGRCRREPARLGASHRRPRRPRIGADRRCARLARP